MKKLLFFALTTVGAASAFAHGDSRGDYGQVTSCSDSRLYERFSYRADAEDYCSSMGSDYVAVGVTYLRGERSYTCSCDYTNKGSDKGADQGADKGSDKGSDQGQN